MSAIQPRGLGNFAPGLSASEQAPAKLQAERHGQEGRGLQFTLAAWLPLFLIAPRGISLAVGLAIAVGWRLVHSGRRSSVRIDPVANLIDWHVGPLLSRKRSASFRDITGTTPADDHRSDGVTIHFGAEQLTIRVPKGQGERFAASLRAVAGLDDAPAPASAN